ncbi:PAS domain-containing sensor histidine kinase [Mangrovivirga cuniculi]|uniref:histidine kinase n=1 Tax=Mangrovivirga cuniculi TaxID=2715131 RepID=A0A4D7JZQ0_9BACT|nr:PAS domain-containing sensor histidine kinase [Mangrovivirga cuniculi]QCK16185.1 hypothetical protein DCC35_16260 [Mangrovivirga cuniculi]
MTDYELKCAVLEAENKELKEKLTRLERKLNNSNSFNKSERFLKSILDHSPTAIGICEAPDGRITYVNDAVWNFRGETDASLTDITIEEYVNSWRIFSPEGREYTGAEMPMARSLIEGIVIKNEEFIIQLDDGTRKWGAIWSAPIYDDKNNIIAAIAIFDDITHRKTMENKIKKSEEYLNRLNSTKDKFFSIIAHDLRSPFSSILGLANLLEKQVKENNLDGIEEYSRLIKKSTKKAIELLENLIQWSRTQSDTITMAPENIDLKNLIPHVIGLLKYHAKQKYIDIKCDIPDKSKVKADPKMLRTILRNLISNAIKFTRENGEINIKVEDQKSEYHVIIADNGVGIPKDKFEKLFNIEESTSMPGTKNETGTGLGLILCKEFVEKHGGNIWVDSMPGKGSTFTFTIPKKEI